MPPKSPEKSSVNPERKLSNIEEILLTTKKKKKHLKNNVDSRKINAKESFLTNGFIHLSSVLCDNVMNNAVCICSGD